MEAGNVRLHGLVSRKKAILYCEQKLFKSSLEIIVIIKIIITWTVTVLMKSTFKPK